ncbi:MAG: gamma-glutamyl-gamma-aminobutyrate hydrolase family protein [Chloroflexi bacterium]|nr:gamma-glutamyl-gamma-aminobutyrate hydrolase family protein [Chloroflexota bacterium]
MAKSRPRIGVTRWEDIPGERIEDYWERVEEAGGEAVDLRGVDISIASLNGLILTGGLDIDPKRYGEEPHERTKIAERARDEYEINLVRAALEADLPVLAICRGSQVLNVAMGGRLLQNIETSNHRADYKSDGYPSRWHSVRLEAGSRLRELYASDDIEVNSRHHQGVLPEMVASGLTAVAISPDGVVEATESTAHSWVTGVQWHPERTEAEHPHFLREQRALFAAFVGAAKMQPEPVASA